jgi:hypothetical protein
VTTETWREHYRRLFRTTGYDAHSSRRGPAFWESIRDLLEPPIADLGCGRGHFVRWCLEQGLDGTGFDWVDAGADRVADITQPLDLAGYRTATAFDVLEHVPEAELDGVLANLAIPGRWIVTIDNKPSRPWLGRQLHVTRLSWPDWRLRLGRRLIVEGERSPWPKRAGRVRLFYGRGR